MNDVLTWVGLVAAGGSIVAVITFWMNRGKAEGENAATSVDAKKIALEAHAKISALDASFGLYRERVAADYVSRTTLREVETRITDAIDRIGERMDRMMEASKTR